MGLIVLVAGCAQKPPITATSKAAVITSDDLLLGQPLMTAQVMQPIIAADDILNVDESMRTFLDEYVNPRSSKNQRLEQLLRALINDGSFGLVYQESTQTASDTFASRAGNCLSFTNMFIAMAREVGLDVSYQEVDIPPDWTMHGDTYLLNRHVNIRVDLGVRGERIVDFNIDDFKSTYSRRQISDERAYAHFFNNKGVEQIQAGNNSAALQLLRTALDTDRSFAAGWSNLATLYNRVGAHAYAEAAYLEALRLQPDELPAMSNLARLYKQQGNQKLADYYRNRVRHHRERNPYYRYSLARQAFLERNYDEAINHLEYAVRKKQWEDSFYFLLGLSYLQKGDEKQARKWLHKAEEVAQSDALKRNYQSKIDLLLSTE